MARLYSFEWFAFNELSHHLSGDICWMTKSVDHTGEDDDIFEVGSRTRTFANAFSSTGLFETTSTAFSASLFYLLDFAVGLAGNF